MKAPYQHIMDSLAFITNAGHFQLSAFNFPWNELLPQTIIAAASVIVMLSVAARRSHLFVYILTLIAFILAFVSLCFVDVTNAALTPLFIIDGLGIFFTGLILCAGFFITLISYHYLQKQETKKEEYYILLLLAALGSLMMVISNHFVAFFLSLELLSVPLYALIAYLKEQETAIEAGIKYLVLAAVSSSFLLFGIALVYAQTGQLELGGLTDALAGRPTGLFFMAGCALIIAGIGFKLALVPFHLWTPDVYAGAAAPVSAFIATISKGGVFVFLLRLFYAAGGLKNHNIWIACCVIAVASMLIGNWLALRQQNVKRILAYSSIAHLGYLLVAFLAASHTGVNAAAFYLVVYFVSTLGAFGVITSLSGKGREADDMEDYRGLFWSKPWLAAFFTAVLLSLAGIPLTAGFMGKFYLLAAGSGSGLWFLMIVLVVSSTIGLFYYLGIVAAMFSGKKSIQPVIPPGASFPNAFALAMLFILLLWFGIFPASLLNIIHQLIT